MPPDPQTTAWLDQEDAHLARVIRQHAGRCSTSVPARRTTNRPFGYTIGLLGLGHPELVLGGYLCGPACQPRPGTWRA